MRIDMLNRSASYEILAVHTNHRTERMLLGVDSVNSTLLMADERAMMMIPAVHVFLS